MKTIAFEDAYMVILFISAFGLIFLPEVIYIKDIYGITYQRANTMFKFTYQSFMMMGIAAGYVVIRLVSTVTRTYGKFLASVGMAIVIGLPMMFPFYAIEGYYGNILKGTYKGLDGEAFLESRYADDYYAVQWLKDNVKGQPVVLEAAGDAYTDYERISALTGLPTIVGWGGHEWLWRGGYDKVGVRVEDVRLIYESDDMDETLRLIRKYGVSYIVIGQLENEKYANINIEKFNSIGQRVFTSVETTIIKVD
jgi:YYY domain-containing protein